MSEPKPTRDAKLTREERLAAKLRENLRRRKSQARAIETRQDDENESGGVPKSAPES